MSFSISLAIVIRPRPGALWLLLRPPESRSAPYRQDVRQGQIRTLAFVALHATSGPSRARGSAWDASRSRKTIAGKPIRSEEHTSELQSLMRISYAVFCLKKNNTTYHTY